MAVHIGSIIKDLVKTKRIKIDDFAYSINCTRRNVYKIFDKPSIDTNLLATINKSLGQNLFFNYIKDEEIAEYRNSKVKSTELLEVLKNIEATISDLHKEKETKKRTNIKKSTKIKINK